MNTRSLAMIGALSAGAMFQAPIRSPKPAPAAKPMKYPFQNEQHLQGAWYGDGVEPTKVTRQMRRMQERQSKR